MIAFRKPELPKADELAPYLAEIDRNGIHTGHGPLCRTLEEKLKALCVSSGTAALEIALSALDLPPGSLVACPATTYIASATAIVRAGLKPYFMDVDRRTWTLNAKIPLRVRAVMLACPFGRSPDAIPDDVPVVIDAAAAYGNPLPPLHQNAIACYSMHATKLLPAAEGGFIRTVNPTLYSRCRALACFGSTGSAIFSDVEGGTNAKLSEYHAAIALASLQKMPARFAYLDELAAHYHDLTVELLPKVHLQSRPAHEHASSFEIALDAPLASECAMALADHGIEARRPYFPPAHRHTSMRNFERASLANTEWLEARLIGLPFGTHVSLADATRIVCTLARVYKGFSTVKNGRENHAAV